jgi:hypothetical protein
MPPSEAQRGRRRALLVATATYADPALAQLRAPAGDVAALGGVLSDPSIGGFEVAQRVDRPTDELKREIEDFFQGNRRDDLLLLYLSGHGVLSPDRQLYFATSTTELKLLRATAIEDSFVNAVIQHSRARSVVLVLDCCHSGAFASGMRPKGTESIDVEHRFEGGRGRVTLTASTELEYAFEEDKPRSAVNAVGHPVPGSVFTRYLVEGLETGDADVNEDGLISVDEIYDYVCTRVHEHSRHQTPGMAGDKRGDILIARSRRAAMLPREFVQAIESPLPSVRHSAVGDLEALLRSPSPGVAVAVIEALEELTRDDSRRVSTAAKEALERRRLTQPATPRSQAAVEPEPESEPVHEPEAHPSGSRLSPTETLLAGRSAEPPRPPPTRRGRPGRRHAATVAVGIAVAGAVAALLLTGGEGAPPQPPQRAGPPGSPYDFTGDGRQELVASVPVDAEVRGAYDRRVLIHSGGPDGKLVPELSAIRVALDESAKDMGAGIASADFDGDGDADLAVGTPSKKLVTILYLGPEGVEESAPIEAADVDPSEAIGRFGFPLVGVNLDGDEFDDLVIGAPRSGRPSPDARLHVVFGSRQGLRSSGARKIRGPRHPTFRFGARIRAGNINGDRHVDLAEGAPDGKESGHASWCPGTPTGPTACDDLEAGGTSNLAIADLDGDERDDVIQGDARDPDKTSVEQKNATAGVVRVLRLTASGRWADPETITATEIYDARPADEFGFALDAGDFDGDGRPELAVGAPGAGRAFVIGFDAEDLTRPKLLTTLAGSGTFGNTLALLDLTDVPGYDLVVTAPRAVEAGERVVSYRGGDDTPRSLQGVGETMAEITPDARGVPGRDIPLGRRAGG